MIKFGQSKILFLIGFLIPLFGFIYYVYNTAERKGWFLTKAKYFTFTDRATGLKVGDPVTLMGFDAGQRNEQRRRRRPRGHEAGSAARRDALV